VAWAEHLAPDLQDAAVQRIRLGVPSLVTQQSSERARGAERRGVSLAVDRGLAGQRLAKERLGLVEAVHLAEEVAEIRDDRDDALVVW
jgi:hypothetical protein